MLKGAQYAALEGTPFFSEAFKISQKGEDKDGGFEVSLGSNLWLHFLVQSLMHKSAPHNSSNGEFDGSLEGSLNGGLDVALEAIT